MYVMRQPARFLSAATVMIDQPARLAEGTAADIDKLSRLRLKYVGLIRTTVTAGPVAEKLGVPEPIIRRSLAGTIIPQSLLFTVESRARRPELAQRVAQAGGEQIAAYAKQEQDSLGIAPEKQFKLTVVVAAEPGAKFSPTTSRLQAVAVAGGVIGIATGYIFMRLIAPSKRRDDPALA
jgi:hypothetical protein